MKNFENRNIPRNFRLFFRYYYYAGFYFRRVRFKFLGEEFFEWLATFPCFSHSFKERKDICDNDKQCSKCGAWENVYKRWLNEGVFYAGNNHIFRFRKKLSTIKK